MVLKAVLTLAARHEAILTRQSDWEASTYHGECLELLIPALDRLEKDFEENLLITVVILRICEELENSEDQRFHLTGSNRLVNLSSRSGPSCGVVEAVSWQFLRQAIYSSIVQYQNLELDLYNYERSSMFQRDDDFAFANMAIFHCAHIVQLCRVLPDNPVDEQSWGQVADAVDEWYQHKPLTWQPMRYQDPDVNEDRPFPEIWMTSAPAGMFPFEYQLHALTYGSPSCGNAILPRGMYLSHPVRSWVARPAGIRIGSNSALGRSKLFDLSNLSPPMLTRPTEKNRRPCDFRRRIILVK
jgi:hypothetical protein